MPSVKLFGENGVRHRLRLIACRLEWRHEFKHEPAT
jgi:hypothetical protein